MPSSPDDTTMTRPAPYLDMPDDRRAAAIAHAALLGKTVRAVAPMIPLSADVDDFRRVLVSEAGK